MRELAKYDLSPLRGLPCAATISRGSVLRTPPPACGLVTPSGFGDFKLHTESGLHTSNSTLHTEIGEALLTAFCSVAELDKLIPYEVCTAVGVLFFYNFENNFFIILSAATSWF